MDQLTSTDNLEKLESKDQKYQKKSFVFKLAIISPIIVSLIILAVFGYYYFSTTTPTSIPKSSVSPKTPSDPKVEKFHEDSRILIEAMEEIQIDAELAVAIQKDSNLEKEASLAEFIPDKEEIYATKSPSLTVSFPELEGLSIQEVQTKFKQYLLDLNQETIGIALQTRTDYSVVFLLDQFLYMSRLAKSPQVSDSDKVKWKNAIMAGESVALDMAEFAVVQREELKQYVKDLFKTALTGL